MQLVVCTQSGTILPAEHCYLVDSDKFEQYLQDNSLDTDCDQDTIQAVKAVGTSLEAQ